MKLIFFVTLLIIVCASLSASSLDHFFTLIKREILDRERVCTNILHFVAQIQYSDTHFLEGADERGILETFLLVQALGNETEATFRQLVTLTRLHKPCFLLLVDPLEIIMRNETSVLETWPSTLRSATPSYIFFYLDSSGPTLIDNEVLVTMLSVTRRLLHAFVLFRHDAEKAVEVFGREFKADKLHLTSRYSPNDSHRLRLLTEPKPNFDGEEVMATVCVVCDKALETFHKTGQWTDSMVATMYELAQAFNGTLALKAVFGLPSTGMTADGEWDGFVEPTLDGSAVLVELLQLTPENGRVIHLTNPFYFDSICFITDKPKRRKFTSLSKIIQPLEPVVWMALILAAVCLLIALEIAIEATTARDFERGAQMFRPRQQLLSVIERSLISDALPAHSTGWTVFALIVSLWEQTAMFSKDFSSTIGKSDICKFLIALWYVLIIVLGSGYKSHLTSSIVTPTYDLPPTTFQELVDSDYAIGSVFWTGGLDLHFLTFNTSMSRAIQGRVREYDFADPDVSFSLQLTYNQMGLTMQPVSYVLSVLCQRFRQSSSMHCVCALRDWFVLQVHHRCPRQAALCIFQGKALPCDVQLWSQHALSGVAWYTKERSNL